MNKILLYILIIVSNVSFGQINIKDAEANSFAYIKENVLLDSAHQVLYNYKGSIIFNKNSSKKEDIALTVDIRKFKTNIYLEVETEATWFIKNNSIFWKKNREDILICTIEIKDGFTSIYNANTDSLIAFLDKEEVSSLDLSFAFFHIWNTLDLETVLEKQSVISTEGMPEGVVGYMKPVFGDPLNVWVWDGEVLYHAYDADPNLVWTFDGSTIKPEWNSRTQFEWSWDGEELSPYWGGHPRNNWRWEGNIFRQIFESNYKNEFELVDNVARKRFGSYGDLEWEIHGDMPLPLVSIVLLGIVYRR